MPNIKYIDTALKSFTQSQTRNLSYDGSLQISIITILDDLKKYEIGIPKNYYEKYGNYYGTINWLNDQVKQGNIIFVSSNNTYDINGNVSTDFGFTQFDSLVSDESFVFMHIDNGNLESLWRKRFPAILLRFKKGTSFYDILDNITFENPNVPSFTIEINNKHYIVLPKITNGDYYVKCIETDEELEATDKIEFSGSEEIVKEQIETYLRMKRILLPETHSY